MNMQKTAVFLDLQGTLGGTGIDDISTFHFYPFTADAIKEMNKHGLLAIVITNQSNISRGTIKQEQYDRRMEELLKELVDTGVLVDGVYCCPHTREDRCNCKKPLPGLALRAAKEHGIDLGNSYVVGDMGMNDIVLARNIGAKGILVRTGAGEGSLKEFRDTWKGYEADFVADNILDAVHWILSDIKRT